MFLKNISGNDDEIVTFANLNTIIDRGDDAHPHKIVISLVTIEEDQVLQNEKSFCSNPRETGFRKPAIRINITRIFTLLCKMFDNYEGIKLLEYVLQYFRNKPIINMFAAEDDENFLGKFQQITVELLSLEFERTNYLCNLFGRKYLPPLVYKFRTFS